MSPRTCFGGIFCLLKNWHGQWKINLIESVNLKWKDLPENWYDSDKESQIFVVKGDVGSRFP